MFYHALTGNSGTTPVEDLKPVLLWENPSPASEFAAQTVNLDLTDYAGVLVEFNKSTAQPTFISRIYSKKGETIGSGCNNTTEAKAREITVNNSGVVFGPAINGGTNNVSNIMMPTKIYGVKEYVVEQVGELKRIEMHPDLIAGTKTVTIQELTEIYSIFLYTTDDKGVLDYATKVNGVLNVVNVGGNSEYNITDITDNTVTITSPRENAYYSIIALGK